MIYVGLFISATGFVLFVYGMSYLPMKLQEQDQLNTYSPTSADENAKRLTAYQVSTNEFKIMCGGLGGVVLGIVYIWIVSCKASSSANTILPR